MCDRLAFDLSVSLADFRLDMAAELPAEGVTAIVGPSGAGKTTLLRALAGLVPAQGEICLGAEKLDDLPAHRRGVGYVFQDAQLFAHLNVVANVRYGARRRGTGEGAIAAIIDALDLGPLLERDTRGLSGGEARRVALGRALASNPRLLLLDEPLSGLDAARKAEILPYLARALHDSGVPTLLVTHAEDEALSLADRILTVADGRVVGLRTGPPRIEATVRDVVDGAARLDIAGRTLSLALVTRAGARWALAVPEGGGTLCAYDPGPSDAAFVCPVMVMSVSATTIGLSIDGQMIDWPRAPGASWTPETGDRCVLIVTKVVARPVPG